jgi:hypothetical protein
MTVTCLWVDILIFIRGDNGKYLNMLSSFRSNKNCYQNSAHSEQLHVVLYFKECVIYLFCSSIIINTVIVTAGNFEP